MPFTNFGSNLWQQNDLESYAKLLELITNLKEELRVIRTGKEDKLETSKQTATLLNALDKRK